jgi:AraC-like DNA-binding protein
VQVDEYARARPSPGLRPYVGFYTGYRQHGLPPRTHRGLPSPYLTLILTLDDPLVVAAHPDTSQAAGRYDALVGGLHLTPAIIEHGGRQSGIQVAVSPLGCRALFGMPAGELAGVDVDLAAVVDPASVAAVRDRIGSAATWPERFAGVDAWLCRLARDRPSGVHPGVAHVFHRLLTSGGDVPIGMLAGEVGWSARHLTNRFHAEVGLRPKEAARVARFDRARRRLAPGVRLADVAAGAGYFDQAHLAREFTAFAGCSPSRWMAEEIGFVQDERLLIGQD